MLESHRPAQEAATETDSFFAKHLTAAVACPGMWPGRQQVLLVTALHATWPGGETCMQMRMMFSFKCHYGGIMQRCGRSAACQQVPNLGKRQLQPTSRSKCCSVLQAQPAGTAMR